MVMFDRSSNEPLAYREVISGAIKELRPQVEILAAKPTALDEEFLRHAPGLVVCSQITPLIEREALTWVELYPNHTSGTLVSLAGEKKAFEAMV